MAVKKLFSVSAQRNWGKASWQVKRRHEFDSKYFDIHSLRNKCVGYDEALVNTKHKTVPNGSFIKKLSETTRLPESVINAVLLDFVDLIALAISKNKDVGIWGFGRFECSNEEVLKFIPAKPFKEIILELLKNNNENSENTDIKE